MADSPRQLYLGNLAEKEPPKGTIQLYVVSPPSNLAPLSRQLIDREVALIKQTATEASKEAGDPWALSIHAPFDWSAPWVLDGRSPEAVYELNSRKIREECDGMVVLGHQGGSYGGGQEIAWAAELRLPILYCLPDESATGGGQTHVSRQVEGTPADMQVLTYRGADELCDGLVMWIRSRRAQFESSVHRREDRVLEYGPITIAFAERWAQLSVGDRRAALADSGLHPRVFAELLTRPSALAAASLDAVHRFSTALGLPVPVDNDRPIEMTEVQRSALLTAADESDWEPSFTLRLFEEGLRELNRGGVRRISFNQPSDWRELARRQHG